MLEFLCVSVPTIELFAQLDHFNFKTEPQTWQQRYLIVDEFYKPGCVRTAC